MPTDYRWKICEDCGGDGEVEGPFRHFCRVSGNAWGDVRRCDSCDGAGNVCVELEPVELEDLDA